MGIASSREWEPADSFTIFEPPAWPSEHTDEQGNILPFKKNGRFQNPAMAGRDSPLSFFWSVLTGILSVEMIFHFQN